MVVEETAVIITLIIGAIWIAFMILGIILFIKIWKMTSDVRNIKDKYIPIMSQRNKLRIHILYGEKDAAKRLIIDSFFKLINDEQWNKDLPDYNKKTFLEYKEGLVDDLAKIGEEVPESIMKLESIEDFRNIF